MSKPSLTILVLTKNETLHIRRCIESLKNIAEKIIILDSFSTDDTMNIINEYGELIEFYQNKWINYSSQFQWGLDNIPIKTDWVMRMDADEYIDDDLQKEIISDLPNLDKSKNCVFIRRKYYYKDKWIKYGAVYPLVLLRIWRTGEGRIEQRWMDEHMVVKKASPIRFKGHIIDHNLNDMRWWIDKHIRYADREVVDLLNIKHSLFERDGDIISKGGAKGWDFHLMQGLWYRSYVDIRYKELDKLISNIDEKNKKIEVLAKSTGLNF
jgi:glycosyltransferase involved in cell wall biosynthesis